jgi:hypothetical protein
MAADLSLALDPVNTSGLLTLSEQDRKDILRVVATEVDHNLARTDPEEYQRQAAGVIDTILNRVASPQYPDTVREVVNQRNQFSAINGPRTKKYTVHGAVENVPDSAIPSGLVPVVNDWLDKRIMGTPSIVGGGLNYANPDYSDESNRAWVEALDGPRFGHGDRTHYHGTTAGSTPFEATLTGSIDAPYPAVPVTPAKRDMSKYVVGIDGSLVEKPTGKRLPSLSGQQLTPAQRAIMDALGGQQAAMPYGDSGLNTRSVQSVEINPYTGMPYRQRSIDNERPGTDLELGTGRPNFIDKVVSTRVDNNGVPNHPGTFTRTGMTSDKPLNTTPLQSALDKLRRSAETRIAGGSGTDTFSGGSGELLRQTPGQSIIERAPNSNSPEFITKTIQVPVQTPGLTASTEVTGPEYLKGGTMELHSGARDSVAQQQLARDVLARAAAAQKPPEQQFETQTIQIRNPAYVAPQQVPQQKPVPIQGDGGFLGGVFDTIGNAAGQAVNFVKDPVVGAGLRFMKMRGDIDQAIKAPFGRDTGRTYDADANEWVSNGPQAAPQQATLLGPVGQSGTASGGNPPKGTPLQQIISSLSGLVQRPKLGPVAQAMVNQRFADLSKSTTGAEGGVSENAKDQFGNWRPGYGPSSDYSAYEAALKKLREPQTAFSVNGGPVPVRMI